ncbi:Redoxin [Sarocladium strictum]
MSVRASLRRFPIAAARPAIARRSFHASPRALVRVGQEIPNLEVLVEGSPGNKVNLADEFASENGWIVGVPGAFSGTCSAQHVPSYINHPKLKTAGKVFVVSVNDAFVMKAWGEQLDPAQDTQIRFLGDPAAEFTKALDLDWDASAAFGNARGKRYALKIEDGKVKEAHVEPDNAGFNVSDANKVL